jgi:hypothetical protein
MKFDLVCWHIFLLLVFHEYDESKQRFRTFLHGKGSVAAC